MEEGFRTQDYLLYAIPMLDFEPEFNVGLWTQFSLIKGSNLILELEPDDPIGQFNNVFWTLANDSISLSKKLTCWVLKGPTSQSSPRKATASRGGGCGGRRHYYKLFQNQYEPRDSSYSPIFPYSPILIQTSMNARYTPGEGKDTYGIKSDWCLTQTYS